MKKLIVLALCIFGIVGFAYSDIYNQNDMEGYWFGNALEDKTAGMVMCDNRYGLAYLGLYSEKKIPGLERAHACNLAISMDKNGRANMQVIDPENGKVYNLDLLELAKQFKEDVNAESVESLKAKNAELEKRIEELVAELIKIESKRGQE